MPMGKEQEGQASGNIPLTGIYLDIPSKTVIFAAKTEVVATLTLSDEGLIFDATPRQIAAPTPVGAPPQLESGEPSVLEREKPVTLSGRLKNKPQQGRPDARGNPTAWARFAAHEEDEDGAHMYSTTFHRQTVEIALGLEKDMPVTVQGFPHAQDDPESNRMDTLSVINLLDYPGKAKKR